MTSEQRAESVPVARPPVQAERGGSTPTSALQLWFHQVEFTRARELNALWHSRLPRFGTGFIKNMPFLSFAASFDDAIYAVAIWSNPAARLLPQKTWLELRRLAIAPDAPRNTASRMLAIMARLIRKDRPQIERLVSYQDTEAHTGGIYRAAGWSPTTVSGSGEWNRPNSFNMNGTPRTRPKAQSAAPKQRWEKVLYERPRETGTGSTDPAGAVADVPLPGRREGDAEERHAPAGSPARDAPVDR